MRQEFTINSCEVISIWNIEKQLCYVNLDLTELDIFTQGSEGVAWLANTVPDNARTTKGPRVCVAVVTRLQSSQWTGSCRWRSTFSASGCSCWICWPGRRTSIGMSTRKRPVQPGENFLFQHDHLNVCITCLCMCKEEHSNLLNISFRLGSCGRMAGHWR